MATSSLGRLTLDLAVRLSEFTDGMSRAERETQERTQHMQESVTSFREHLANELGGTQIAGIVDSLNERFGSLEGGIGKISGALGGMLVGGVAIGIGALANMAIETAKADAQMAILANRAHTSVESFQILAGAAEGLGVSQEDLGSILADVQEKLGEFSATEGGEAADFFDALKNNTKMTEEQIRSFGKTLQGKDGVEAIQIIKDKLEELGATSQEQRFIFESLGSDLGNLMPLFADGGKLLGEYGEALQEAGVIKTQKAIEQSQILAAQTQAVHQRFEGFKSQLAGQMIPILGSLGQYFFSGGQKGSAFGGVIQGVGVIAKGVASVILVFGGAIGLLGDTIGQIIAQWSNIGSTAVNFLQADTIEGKMQALSQGFQDFKTMGSDYISNVVTRFKELDSAIDDVVNNRAVATDKLVQANLTLERSQLRINDGLKVSTKQAKDAEKAEKDLAKAKEKAAKEAEKREATKGRATSIVQTAAKEIGVSEKNNPARIMGYQKEIGYMANRIDYWCASFVGASLERAGFKSTGSASAKSYETYGNAFDKNKKIPAGSIGVIARNGGSGRHVFIIEKDNGDGTVSTIDGNWGHKVQRTTHKKSDLVTVRIPITIDGKPASQSAVSSALSLGNDRQGQVYNAWKKAGLSEQQAKIMTAEVGREGDYLDKNLFGFHQDRNNGSINMGMLSWQKDRGKELKKYLTELGLFKNGAIVQSQDSLDAMAAFAVKEMLGGGYKKTKSQFLTNKNIDAQKAFEIEGREFVGWDIDGKYGMSAKDVARAKAKRDKYYSQISNRVMAVGDGNPVKDYLEQQKNDQQQLQKALELRQKYGDKEVQIAAQVQEKINKINENTVLSDIEKQKMREQATKEGERELEEYKKSLADKLDALSKYRASELSLINKARNDAIFTAEHDKDLIANPEKLAIAKAEIEQKWRYDIDQYQAKMQKQRNELLAYTRDERQIIADGWNDKIADAKLATDELADLRITSLEAQRDRELELFDIKQAEEQLALKKNHLTTIEYINQKYDLIDRREAASKEQKAINQQTNWENRNAELVDTAFNANANYRGMMAGLHGQTDIYNANNANTDERQSRMDIAKQAMDAGLIQAEEYNNALLEIDKAYLAKKQEIWASQYSGVFSSLTSTMGAFFGEQSKMYRAAAAMQQGYAVFQAMMAVPKTYSDTLASLSAIPLIGPYIAPPMAAAAAAMQVAQAAKIRGMVPPSIGGVAHGGMDYIPKETTFLLDKGERVLSPRQNKDLTRYLNDRQNATQGNVIVNNNSSAQVSAQRQSNGEVTVEVVDKMIKQSWGRVGNANSHESRQLQRHTTARFNRQ